MRDDARANKIAETLSSSRGRRFLAWEMTKPMLRHLTVNGNVYGIGAWENYPDSPKGTLEVWEDERP